MRCAASGSGKVTLEIVGGAVLAAARLYSAKPFSATVCDSGDTTFIGFSSDFDLSVVSFTSQDFECKYIRPCRMDLQNSYETPRDLE